MILLRSVFLSLIADVLLIAVVASTFDRNVRERFQH
jgi:hypothetical protein